MKATIDISDKLLERARKHAARHGVTLKALVETGLRRVLAEKSETRPFRLRKASFKGQGLHRGVRDWSWHAICEKAWEGRGG